MKMLKKATSLFVVLAMLVSLLAIPTMASDTNILTINKAGTYEIGNRYTKVIVKADNVIIEGGSVDEIVIDETLSDGEVTIDSVTAEKVTVNSKGDTSLNFENDCNIEQLIIESEDGKVEITTDDTSTIDLVSVENAQDDVTLSGTFVEIEIVGDEIELEFSEATVEDLIIEGIDNVITFDRDTLAETVVVDKDADGNEFIIEGEVEVLETEGEDTAVSVDTDGVLGTVRFMERDSKLDTNGQVDEVLVYEDATGIVIDISNNGVVSAVASETDVEINSIGDGTLELTIGASSDFDGTADSERHISTTQPIVGGEPNYDGYVSTGYYGSRRIQGVAVNNDYPTVGTIMRAVPYPTNATYVADWYVGGVFKVRGDHYTATVYDVGQTISVRIYGTGSYYGTATDTTVGTVHYPKNVASDIDLAKYISSPIVGGTPQVDFKHDAYIEGIGALSWTGNPTTFVANHTDHYSVTATFRLKDSSNTSLIGTNIYNSEGTVAVIRRTESEATVMITYPKTLVSPTNEALSHQTIELAPKTSAQISVIFEPIDVSNKQVEWSSNNTTVAVVDQNGVVTAIATGVATITAKTAYGTNLSLHITVLDKPFNEITLSPTGLNLFIPPNPGSVNTIVATDESGAAITVSWNSSNTLVATVDASGTVTAVGEGTAIITAISTQNNLVKASCTVTVKDNRPVITSDLYSLVLDAEATITIPTGMNLDATPFTFGTAGILTANGDKLTAVKPGSTTVTAQFDDGSESKPITITVLPFSISGTQTVFDAKDQTAQLTVLNPPEKGVSWTSDYDLIVSVDSSGKITVDSVPSNDTEVTITATSTSGETANYKVLVKGTSAYLTVSPSTLTLGQTASLSLSNGKTITGLNGAFANIGEFSSASFKATKEGNADVTATYDSAGQSQPANVTVVAPTITGGNTVVKSETLNLGLSYSLPSGFTVEWSSTGDATVDSTSGVVTAGSAVGNATITATIKYNGTDAAIVTQQINIVDVAVTTKASSDMLVAPLMQKVAADPTKLTVVVGDEIPINTPTGIGSATFVSANPLIATVDATGFVAGVAIGQTTVTATFDGEDKQVIEHTINVVEKIEQGENPDIMLLGMPMMLGMSTDLSVVHGAMMMHELSDDTKEFTDLMVAGSIPEFGSDDKTENESNKTTDEQEEATQDIVTTTSSSSSNYSGYRTTPSSLQNFSGSSTQAVPTAAPTVTPSPTPTTTVVDGDGQQDSTTSTQPDNETQPTTPGFSLDKNSATINVGKTATINVVLDDDGTLPEHGTWTTSNADIVSITEVSNGGKSAIVIANGVGEETITYSLNGTNLVCIITVVGESEEIVQSETEDKQNTPETDDDTITPTDDNEDSSTDDTTLPTDDVVDSSTDDTTLPTDDVVDSSTDNSTSPTDDKQDSSTGDTTPPADDNQGSSTGDSIPPADDNQDSSTGDAIPPADDNQDSSTGDATPPAGDNTSSSTDNSTLPQTAGSTDDTSASSGSTTPPTSDTTTPTAEPTPQLDLEEVVPTNG